MTNSRSDLIKLVPGSQHLVDDFIFVRERFDDLEQTLVQQLLFCESQKTEIEDLKEKVDALQQKECENEQIISAYNQLKVDYDRLNSTAEIHRMEIYNANKKRVDDLEKELEVARAKLTEKSDFHASKIAEYQTKLQAANDQIRELTYKNRIERSRVMGNTADTENISPAKLLPNSKPRREITNRFPQLDVEIAPRGSRNRGRGKPRSGGSRRKLFRVDDDEITDLS